MSDLLFNGVFPKWSRTFIEFSEFSEIREFDKSLKHELGSLKDLVFHMCLAGAVVALWSFKDKPTLSISGSGISIIHDWSMVMLGNGSGTDFQVLP